MKTNKELHTVDAKDFINEIAKMIAMDTVGSHAPRKELIEWLTINVEKINEVGFNNYNGLKYNCEDKYDAILDIVEDNELV